MEIGRTVDIEMWKAYTARDSALLDLRLSSSGSGRGRSGKSANGESDEDDGRLHVGGSVDFGNFGEKGCVVVSVGCMVEM